jgi:hypothetical protein
MPTTPKSWPEQAITQLQQAIELCNPTLVILDRLRSAIADNNRPLAREMIAHVGENITHIQRHMTEARQQPIDRWPPYANRARKQTIAYCEDAIGVLRGVRRAIDTNNRPLAREMIAEIRLSISQIWNILADAREPTDNR